MLERGNKKIMNAWAFYDWANSVYALVITSAIFPIFYNALFHIAKTENIRVFGIMIKNTALISFISAFSFLIISFISPLLSGISDYIGNKKIFMKIFCYIGALSCIGLYFFDLSHIYISITFYILALIGFWGSIVFYNSYLPDIAHEKDQDALSARGFSMGYIGSVILLIFCLAMVMVPDSFGIDGKIQAMRICFVAVGIWWIVFSQYTYYYLPKGNVSTNRYSKNIIFKGIKELKTVYKSLQNNPLLKGYLLGFFIFSMAVQTVMLVATYFGEQEIGWADDSEKTTGLIISILIIQLIAVVGAYLTSKASAKFGNFPVLIFINILWIVICIYAFTIHTPIQFYIAAICVGMVMGGVQSLARSTYSKLIPKTKDTASFFSFYDVTEKVGIMIGMSIFGVVDQITGSIRNSVLSLVLFFIIGSIILYRVHKKYGQKINTN